MVRFFACAPVLALCFAATVSTARGAEPRVDPPLRDAMKSLVEANWVKSSDGLSKAEAAHRNAKALAPNDVRFDYALALMQMRYLRFDDADKTLVGVLTRDADQLDARRLRIRLAAQMKKHTIALEELDRLSERLAAVIDPARADERRDGVAYLGKLFAFYQSPAVKSLPPTAVPDALAKAQSRLTADDQAAFAGGEAAASTVGDSQPAKAEGATIPPTAASAIGDPTKIAADAEAKIRDSVTRIDGLLGPIDAELASINTNGTSLQAEASQLDSQVRTLFSQAETVDDDEAELLLKDQANMKLVQLRNMQAQLQQMVQAANKLKSKRTSLTTDRRVQITRYENEMKRLGVTPAVIADGAAPVAAAAGTPPTGLATGLTTLSPVGSPPPASPLASTTAPTSTTSATLGSFIDLTLEPEKARLLKAFGL